MSLRERGEEKKEEVKGERREGCVRERQRQSRKKRKRQQISPVFNFANILSYC